MIFHKVNFGTKTEELKNLIQPKLQLLFQETPTKEMEDYNPMVNNGVCSFCSPDGNKLYNWPEFQELLNFIDPHLEFYCVENSIDRSSLNIANMWANTYSQYSFVKPHKHGDKKNNISAVFYLQKPEKSGNLHIGIPTDNVPEDCYVEIREGDVILFPSYLMHWSEPNLNTKEKILIGIDYYCYNNEF